MTPANEAINEILQQMKVLLVEDNFFVALDMQRMLESIGCSVVGPVASLEEGLAMIDSEGLSGAILDINIIGGTSAPIAEELMRRNTPFFFVTGYASPSSLPDRLRLQPRLNKPVDNRALRTAVINAFSSPGET